MFKESDLDRSPFASILIADGQTLFRQTLRALLEANPNFAVMGEAADGIEAVSLAAKLRPDIVLVDLVLPRLGGLETVATITRQGSGTRALVLTAAMDRPQQVDALRRGARGIVLKSVGADLLYRSIQCVMAGEVWIGRGVVSDVVDALAHYHAAPARVASPGPVALTTREREILLHVVSGLTNREIAERCALREDTVKHHLTNVFAKTGVSGRLELMLFAINQQMVGAA